MKGTVKLVRLDKGFGFLNVLDSTPEGMKDIFFHAGKVVGSVPFLSMRQGDLVTFDIVREEKTYAVNVCVDTTHRVERSTGTLESVHKGYAFIVSGGKSYFAHFSQFIERVTEADVNRPCEFSLGDSAKGPICQHITFTDSQ